MTSPFVGRKQELAVLEKLLKKHAASLVVIKGRRRIGKSRLVEEFAKKYTFYRFSGLPPTNLTTKQSQLDDFTLQLSKQIMTESSCRFALNELLGTIKQQYGTSLVQTKHL